MAFSKDRDSEEIEPHEVQNAVHDEHGGCQSTGYGKYTPCGSVPRACALRRTCALREHGLKFELVGRSDRRAGGTENHSLRVMSWRWGPRADQSSSSRVLVLPIVHIDPPNFLSTYHHHVRIHHPRTSFSASSNILQLTARADMCRFLTSRTQPPSSTSQTSSRT